MRGGVSRESKRGKDLLMKRFCGCALVMTIGTVTIIIADVHADFDPSNVDHWVGDGDNTAVMVIDWNDGTQPASLAWGYRWDGLATGEDMLRAIVNADDRLFAKMTAPGSSGISLFGLGYDLNNSGDFGIDDGTAFDPFGVAISGPADGAATLDPADHYAEGWNTAFWAYYIGAGGSFDQVAWDFASTGPTGRLLADGDWDGYSFAPGFNFSAPDMPVAAAVPVPGVLLCFGCGVIGASRRRRTRLD
jgi:hypothetical protein